MFLLAVASIPFAYSDQQMPRNRTTAGKPLTILIIGWLGPGSLQRGGKLGTEDPIA